MENGLTQWVGATVTLHDPQKAPDIFGKSVSLFPGTETKIGVNAIGIKKLE